MEMQSESAVFAAGCFWSVEAAFDDIEGVQRTEVGYSNGFIEEPDYKQVCTGNTGHAEVVKVTFDASVISFSALLTIFWGCHNPTHKNKQGVDIGTQYRSGVFYQSDQQRTEAIASMAIQQLIHDKPIVTIIEPLANYCQAEGYHQQYFKKIQEQVARFKLHFRLVWDDLCISKYSSSKISIDQLIMASSNHTGKVNLARL